MHIILGASGQVGAQVVANLLRKGEPVKAVIRDTSKAVELEKQGATVAIADYFDEKALADAFHNGHTVFLLTPETGHSEDVIGDTKKILDNYKKAIETSSIKKLVGLSSMGAQLGENSGNLYMSYLLEHAFTGLPVQQVFVRPAYYFSNWMPYLDEMKKGSLSSFYPTDLPIPMSAPADVALLVSDILVKDSIAVKKIVELEGRSRYTVNEVARAFSKALGVKIKARQIPRNDWEKQLTQMGFTADATRNFIEMTETVNEGKVHTKERGTVQAKGKTSLEEFVGDKVQKNG